MARRFWDLANNRTILDASHHRKEMNMNGIPLSVTFEFRVYMFYVISLLQEKITSVEILLEGSNYKLVLGEDNLWTQDPTLGKTQIEPGLLLKLTNAIELRWLRKH